MFKGLYAMYQAFLSYFDEASIFLTDFRKVHKISRKFVLWEAICFMRTDVQIDDIRDEANSRFS
jgi:hypothetical protein